jgi:WD40 repeat protein
MDLMQAHACAQIYSMAWSPNGKRLASGVLWHAGHMACMHCDHERRENLGGKRMHVQSPSACLIMPPRSIHAGSGDTAIRVWLLEPHSQVAKAERAELELKGHSDYVTALQWKPTNMEVLASAASSDKDKSVRFWDVRSGKVRAGRGGGGEGSVNRTSVLVMP